MASGKQRPYWRPLEPGETVYVLKDRVRESDASPDVTAAIHEQTMNVVSDTAARFTREQCPEIAEKILSDAAQRIVRDLAPGIIERVIREEIEKLKRENHCATSEDAEKRTFGISAGRVE
jgi:hypothetical protein